MSADELDLDDVVTEAARRLCRAAHRDDWPHDDAGPCAAHLTTAETLTAPLVAEVRWLRALLAPNGPLIHRHIPDGDIRGGMLCYNNTGEPCDAWPRVSALP